MSRFDIHSILPKLVVKINLPYCTLILFSINVNFNTKIDFSLYSLFYLPCSMVCRLNTRTTILAATNPKGKYDPNEPLSINVALPSPLLSRFDVVLLLMDNRNHEWDSIISSFILNDRGKGCVIISDNKFVK